LMTVLYASSSGVTSRLAPLGGASVNGAPNPGVSKRRLPVGRLRPGVSGRIAGAGASAAGCAGGIGSPHCQIGPVDGIWEGREGTGAGAWGLEAWAPESGPVDGRCEGSEK
jgi:hypothetical protein